jgi:hypothetical protein
MNGAALSRRKALVAGPTAAARLAVLACASMAHRAARTAAVRSWTLQSEELGTFAKSALASRSDLMLAARLGETMKRDEISYALVMDQAGKARFHGSAADIGRTYDSPTAKLALSATATLVQELPAYSLVEVDVPLPGHVLRVGWSFRALSSFAAWLWGGAATAVAALAAPGLLAFRGA